MSRRNRNNDDVAGIRNRRVNDCEDVFECLLDLLEDALEDDDDDDDDDDDRCRRICRECRRCKRSSWC